MTHPERKRDKMSFFVLRRMRTAHGLKNNSKNLFLLIITFLLRKYGKLKILYLNTLI